MTCRISRFEDGGSLNNYITIFFNRRNFKSAYISSFICMFSNYIFVVCTRRENFIRIGITTVFEELSVSIVDLTVANIHFTGSALRRQ